MKRARAYRDALSRFPTGVTLVTTMDGERACAMTVNSFSSVSLEPALILWSIGRDSARYDLFRNTPAFGINVLASDQEALSTLCAREDNLDLTGAEWTARESGAIFVEGAIARFDCRTTAIHEAGDHDIIVAQVLDFDTPRDVSPLVFNRSSYFQI